MGGMLSSVKAVIKLWDSIHHVDSWFTLSALTIKFQINIFDFNGEENQAERFVGNINEAAFKSCTNGSLVTTKYVW